MPHCASEWFCRMHSIVIATRERLQVLVNAYYSSIGHHSMHWIRTARVLGLIDRHGATSLMTVREGETSWSNHSKPGFHRQATRGLSLRGESLM